MPNQLYQSLFGASEEVVAEALLRDLDSKRAQARSSGCSASYRGQVGALIQDLGGHDLADVIDALARARHRARSPDDPLRVHDQGLGPPDRRAAAEPLALF